LQSPWVAWCLPPPLNPILERVPDFWEELAGRAISYLIIIIIITLTQTFRNMLKTHLFSRSYFTDVHKVTVRQAPSYLTGMLTAVSEVPSLSTLRDASNGNYVIPRTRLKFGERAFSVAAPEHGTACQQNSCWCVPRRFSSVPWKRSCSKLPTVPSSGIALLNWTL